MKPESRGEQTAEERVRGVHPFAWCRPVSGWGVSATTYVILATTDGPQIGAGRTPDESWTHAASKLPPVEPQPEPLWEQAKREVLERWPNAYYGMSGDVWATTAPEPDGWTSLGKGRPERAGWLVAAQHPSVKPEPSVDASPEPTGDYANGVCDVIQPNKKSAKNYGCIKPKGHTGYHHNGKNVLWKDKPASLVAVEGEAKPNGIMAGGQSSYADDWNSTASSIEAYYSSDGCFTPLDLAGWKRAAVDFNMRLAALASTKPQNASWCEFCGPNCMRGAAHNARTEDKCFYGDLAGENALASTKPLDGQPKMFRDDAQEIYQRISETILMTGATPVDWIGETLAVLEADGKRPLDGQPNEEQFYEQRNSPVFARFKRVDGAGQQGELPTETHYRVEFGFKSNDGESLEWHGHCGTKHIAGAESEYEFIEIGAVWAKGIIAAKRMTEVVTHLRVLKQEPPPVLTSASAPPVAEDGLPSLDVTKGEMDDANDYASNRPRACREIILELKSELLCRERQLREALRKQGGVSR